MKNRSIFVVRINLSKYGVFTTTQTETKKRGRHTGASPAVRSIHCIELVRSDRPSLFNFKSIFMRTKNDESAIERLTTLLLHYRKQFEVEKNIKNNLYYFILNQGLFSELRKFEGATDMRSPDGHQNAVAALTNQFINQQKA